MSNEISNLYEFGGFRFDAEKNKIWHGEELILLSPKASALLELLLERNGKYVSKEEIFEKVWADTFVEDGVLTQNIYTLRKILGNDAIENKTRLGYRITIPVLKKDEKLERTNDEINIQNESTPNSKLLANKERRVTLLIIASIIFLTIPTIGYIFRHKITAVFRKPIESVKFTRLTDAGNLTNAALSPDGTFLASVRGDKIFLKDVASNKEILLEIPNVSVFDSLQFSADGNFLYFRNNKSAYSRSKILKTSRFGGDFSVIEDKSAGSFSVSPDNKLLAYYAVDQNLGISLFIKNLETNEERQVSEPGLVNTFCPTCSPAWSADGKKLIHVTQGFGAQNGQIFVIDTATGNSEEIKLPNFRRFEQASWFPDGNSFLLSASEDGRNFHLWKIFYPAGDAQKLTVGLNSYKKPFVSADGKKILSIQSNESSNLFIANAENLSEQKQITEGNSNRFGQSSLAWIDEEKFLFSSQIENEKVENLWLLNTNGQGKKQITSETEFPAGAPFYDGKTIYYHAYLKIMKTSPNGESAAEFIGGRDGARRSPHVSPDGKWIYYLFRNRTSSKIMRWNIADQKEEVFLENENVQCGAFLTLSNDGKYIACNNWRNQANINSEKHNAEILVFSTENKEDIKFYPVKFNPPTLHFSPDNKAIEYITDFEQGTQIMRLALGESEPKPILQMPKDYIFNFAWSKDGKKLALSRGQQYRDAVLLTEFDK